MTSDPASIVIAPSILSADFAALGRDIAAAERGGADLIHVDVMDGHFVPNISIGPLVVRAIGNVATRPLDVHLMIENPDRYLEAFVGAGAAVISVHLEAVPHLHRTLQHIRTLGARAGVAINPSTPVSLLEDVLPLLDVVIVMSVNPGFGAQTFIPQSIEKIRRLRAMLTAAGSAAAIEVDGGVDLGTVDAVVSAGGRILVAGHAIFGHGDPEGATRALRAAASAVHG